MAGAVAFVSAVFVVRLPAARDPGLDRLKQVRRLADQRMLEGPVRAPRAFWDAAHAWYLQGFVHVGGNE